MKLEATMVRGGWYVRPEGQIGTCGFHPEPWEAVYVRGGSADDALVRGTELIRIRRRREARATLLVQKFIRLASIPGAVMYGHDDGRCASLHTDGELKRYATRDEMARELLGE
jgi:hypothetical protein